MNYFSDRLWSRWENAMQWAGGFVTFDWSCTPSRSPWMSSASLTICPESLNQFPNLWTGLWHMNITPTSHFFLDGASSDSNSEPDAWAPCQQSSSNKGAWLLVEDGTEMDFWIRWRARLYHILDLFFFLTYPLYSFLIKKNNSALEVNFKNQESITKK